MLPWRKVLRVGFVFVLALSWPGTVTAEENEGFNLQPGNFGADAWFLEPFVAETWEYDVIEENYIRERDIFVGRFDLNDDGVEEIMLEARASGFCGSAGCDSYVFQRQGESWVVIGGGHVDGRVLTERVCGYRSLVSRDGIDRWNGERYEFAYCFPRENQCRSIAVSHDYLARNDYKEYLQQLDPKNGLIEPQDCPEPQSAVKASLGDVISTTAEAVALNNLGWEPKLPPGLTFDLLPGNYGTDSDFIAKVAAERFERDPPPENYRRARNIHIGRIDVNGDGTSELFIANYHRDACENDVILTGCPFLLFQKQGTEWREIGDGILRYAVFLMDEAVDGYRSIFGGTRRHDYRIEIYRWNSRRYEAVQ